MCTCAFDELPSRPAVDLAVLGTDAGGRSDIEVTCALRPQRDDPESLAPGLASRAADRLPGAKGRITQRAGSVDGGLCRRGDSPLTYMPVTGELILGAPR